jgi:putative zinc finger protein
MDCEKFESAMIDELYGELDEVTSAAAKRHIAGCARCAARIGGLRATRQFASVPLVEPPGDFQDRILQAAEGARLATAPRPRVARVISLAGSWAMRPQTAMAAVFLVMIGTSLLLLRGKSARAPLAAEVTVTEQGTPAPVASVAASVGRTEPGQALPPYPPASPVALEAKQPSLGFAVPPKELAAPAAGVAGGPTAPTRTGSDWPGSAADREEQLPEDQLFDEALRNYRAGRFNEAAREFDALPASNPNAPDLWAARAIRDGKGCRAAVSRFDKTALRDRQAPSGWDALLEGALCYRALGDFATARTRLNALLGVDSHKDRARAELERIDELQQAQTNREAAQLAAAKAAARARTASAPAAAAAPPATATMQAPMGAAPASPAERP